MGVNSVGAAKRRADGVMSGWEGVSGFNLCRRISNSWLDVSVSQCLVSLARLRTNGAFSSADKQQALSPSVFQDRY